MLHMVSKEDIMILLRFLGLVPVKAEPMPIRVDPADGLYAPRPPVTGRTGPRLSY